jgi:hypothetical protein
VTTQQASKLNTYNVVQQTDQRASKVNAYGVLGQTDQRVSKINAYLVLAPAIIAVSATGIVYVIAYAATPTPVVNTITPGFSAVCRGGAVDSANLYTALPASGYLGVMALGSRVFSTVSGSPSIPIPALVATPPAGVATGYVAVAGWGLASVAMGALAVLSSPLLPSTEAILAQATSLSLLTGTDPAWAVASTVTGLTGCTAVAWNPDGTQVLACVAAGVDVFALVGGNLSLANTVSATGCVALAFTPDGTNGLVCRGAANSVGVLESVLDTWSLQAGGGISVTNPKAVLTTGNTTAWVLSGTNVVPLTRTGSAWAAGTAVPLGFTGAAITEDATSGNVLATGGSGGTGYVALIQSGAVVSTLTWAGTTGTAILAQQGQIAVLASDGTTLRVYGAMGATLVYQGVNALAAPSGSTFIGSTAESVWLCGSSTTVQAWWDKPYSIKQRLTGQVGVYRTAGWTTYSLGVGQDPAAIVWDVSGNIWVATAENSLICLGGTATGTTLPVISSQVVPVYSGQEAGTPLGISALTWLGGHLYGASAFCGALIELV